MGVSSGEISEGPEESRDQASYSFGEGGLLGSKWKRGRGGCGEEMPVV